MSDFTINPSATKVSPGELAKQVKTLESIFAARAGELDRFQTTALRRYTLEAEPIVALLEQHGFSKEVFEKGRSQTPADRLTLLKEATVILARAGVRMPSHRALPLMGVPFGPSSNHRSVPIDPDWSELTASAAAIAGHPRLPTFDSRRQDASAPYPIVQWRHGSEGFANHSLADESGHLEAAVDAGAIGWPSEVAAVGAMFTLQPDDYWVTFHVDLGLTFAPIDIHAFFGYAHVWGGFEVNVTNQNGGVAAWALPVRDQNVVVGDFTRNLPGATTPIDFWTWVEPDQPRTIAVLVSVHADGTFAGWGYGSLSVSSTLNGITLETAPMDAGAP